jgi:hypothetical protein
MMKRKVRHELGDELCLLKPIIIPRESHSSSKTIVKARQILELDNDIVAFSHIVWISIELLAIQDEES